MTLCFFGNYCRATAILGLIVNNLYTLVRFLLHQRYVLTVELFTGQSTVVVPGMIQHVYVIPARQSLSKPNQLPVRAAVQLC